MEANHWTAYKQINKIKQTKIIEVRKIRLSKKDKQWEKNQQQRRRQTMREADRRGRTKASKELQLATASHS